MEMVLDVALIHPLIQRINKAHAYKTMDAMHACGVGDHVLPRNFFRRNAYDQRRYFQAVLGLMYCTICRRPMLPDGMKTDASCVECATVRDENWEQVRTRRADMLAAHRPTSSNYQDRARRRNQNESGILNFISAHRDAIAKKIDHVAASNGEQPILPLTSEPTHDNAWDILDRADRREPRG